MNVYEVVILVWLSGLTLLGIRLLGSTRMLLRCQNSIATSVFRLVMVLSGQSLDEDPDEDEVPDSVDDLLRGRDDES